MSQKSDLEFAVQPERQGLHRRFLSIAFVVVMVIFILPLSTFLCTIMLKICRGFNLPCSHVIHTVGPIYDVNTNPQAALKSAYRYPSSFWLLSLLLYHFVVRNKFTFSSNSVSETAFVLPKRTAFNILHSRPYLAVYLGKLKEIKTTILFLDKES